MKNKVFSSRGFSLTCLRELSKHLVSTQKKDELCQKVLDMIINSVKLDFAAIYLRQKDNFNLNNKKTDADLCLPEKIKKGNDLISCLENYSKPLLGKGLPRLGIDLKIGLLCPLRLNENLCGLLVLGQKQKSKIFTDTEIDVFSILSDQISLALSKIYCLKKCQKTAHQKHKLEIEKARLESVSQIADAYRHELGNIINIISLSLINLAATDGHKPSKKNIEETRKAITRNAKRATEIFNAVNRYNQNSKSQPQTQRIDKIIRQVIEKNKDPLSTQNIELNLDIEKEIKAAANNNLSEALNYLIKGSISALEYTNPEKKIIQIRLTKKGRNALLDISYTGGNVSQNGNCQKIRMERSQEGGILYFLAKIIIFDHKGDFKISSFGKSGTTFSIKLPA